MRLAPAVLLFATFLILAGTPAQRSVLAQDDAAAPSELLDVATVEPTRTPAPTRTTPLSVRRPMTPTAGSPEAAAVEGNVARLARIAPPGARAIADWDLSTFWGGVAGASHAYLSWPEPVTIHRIAAWSAGGEPLSVGFSDGTGIPVIDMISDGPRCADVAFPPRSVRWLYVGPYADGASRLREVQVWALEGPQYSSFACWNVRVMTPSPFSVPDPQVAPTPSPTATLRPGTGGHPGLWMAR
jgi:hypothetical protein